ncbi:MAG: hypothetical protein A3D44_02345 [Candidatus Staskawiczbacteria bacterium RIFCSPHIGHO2_02_FULL_42_22]|uniref:Thioredoxin domain-containing protein n=1 Tax=Candidatus Staskawiczbacteria bacterium RIFCSPHIGHO2_02_FULL_42_22 TaxID=1802207 RepID=A0A1G2I217_9BACT|nr:MAG: hypothetical protein A3D44_02345 [Candidatus Staskawiczbacteria bacterium RIFCSPHIGHO2_02_FULL_42_22]
MDTKLRNLILIIVAALAVVGALLYFSWVWQNQPGKLDQLAQCIKDKGAVFYGAFWCPHCQNEKKLFGNSARYLPYVECSTPDSNGQLKVCADQNIKVYPTWRFADGSSEEGELTVQQLADKTGCVVPQ